MTRLLARLPGLYRPLPMALLVFTLTGLMTAALIGFVETGLRDQERTQVGALAANHAQDIQRDVERALTATYALAALVRQGRGEIANFAALAAEMLPYYPGAAALQLAPGGVVRQIFPLAGNEAALGHDLLQDPARTQEAFLARDTGQLTLAGPFTLMQGGLGAVGRLPVFLDADPMDPTGPPRFWGFTNVLLRFPETLDAEHLAQLVEQGFDYVLWRPHPATGERQFIAATTTMPLDQPVSQSLEVPNGRWTLDLRPRAGWGHDPGLALRLALGLAFCLLLAGLAARLTRLGRSLAQAVERYDRMLAASSDAFWLVDVASSRILDVNAAATRLSGWSRREMLTFKVDDIDVDDSPDVIRARTARILATGGVVFQTRHRTRSGDIRNVEISLVPDARARHLFSFIRDITERRRTEEQIQALNVELEQLVARRTAELEQLAQANRAKSEFLANMSHEIRTPLHAVLGLAQILAGEPLANRQREMVGRIQEAGQSLLGIINDILDFSKIEAGQLRIAPTAFDLTALLEKLDRLLGQAARAKGLTLRLMPPDRLPGLLVGDALRLEQVLFNLLGNGIKFTERGEVVLQILPQPASDHTPRLRFEVRDTGIGIAPEARSRLFAPFIQAEEGITRRFGGTGLGLSISKQLVELMGGEIGVDSQPGQGSTFWFELPFGLAEGVDPATNLATSPTTSPATNLATNPVTNPATSPSTGTGTNPAPSPTTSSSGPLAPTAIGSRLSGLRILVVDDSPINREVVESLLAREGAVATPAADGQEAVELLRARPRDFAAVLMDVRMPVMDGLTATRLIREELGLKDLPVIALTAGVLAEQRLAAQRAGVDEFLGKPLDLERLVRALTKRISRVSPPAPAASPAISAIPGLDGDRVGLTFGTDPGLFFRLLDRFIADYPALQAELQAALTAGDRETAGHLLHRLRGNAGNLGALEIMALAERLERALERGDGALEAGVADLDSRFQALDQASGPWRPASPAGTASSPAIAKNTLSAAPTAAEAPLPERLADLADALRHHRLQALKLFAALAPALARELSPEQFRALDQAIQDLRFGTALEQLAPFLPPDPPAPAPAPAQKSTS